MNITQREFSYKEIKNSNIETLAFNTESPVFNTIKAKGSKMND